MELPGDQHTAADIASALQARLQHWRLYDGDVSRVVAATSDNGRDMMNALGTDGLGIATVIGCVAHTINLSVALWNISTKAQSLPTSYERLSWQQGKMKAMYLALFKT